MCTPCQAHAVVKSPSAVKLFVLCPLRAGRFVGADTSSRSFVSRSNRLALAREANLIRFSVWSSRARVLAWGALSSSVLGGDGESSESRGAVDPSEILLFASEKRESLARRKLRPGNTSEAKKTHRWPDAVGDARGRNWMRWVMHGIKTWCGS